REYFSLAEIFFKMQIKKKTTLKVQQDLAESLTWQKKYDEAISVYNDIVATGNFTNKIIFNLAECYRLIGDDKMAVKLYDQYIDEK
ncbi:MAG: tetratricopeptide repeat protein, partial [Candidatus Omnitrophica bacterium]|nr:tetratricopeptide repeat protein [Candidatus Omnitrophota bacterium]